MGAPSVRTPAKDEEPPTGARVVAVDGLSGAGKSTVSRALAQRLRWRYLDTGACYRALTVAALDAALVEVGAEHPPAEGLDALAAAALETLELSLDPRLSQVRLGGLDVTERIRDEATTRTVSAVSADPHLRARAVTWQRARVRCAGACVVEGRDIGTVVLPRAALKVWLCADPAERADRRAAEQRAETRNTVGSDLARRDRLDGERATAPAVAAADAVRIDTTSLSIAQVVDRLAGLAAERGLTGADA
ncbi:MAG: (d)CMP kinase [Mycobacteriales bacterium]